MLCRLCALTRFHSSNDQAVFDGQGRDYFSSSHLFIGLRDRIREWKRNRHALILLLLLVTVWSAGLICAFGDAYSVLLTGKRHETGDRKVVC